MATSIRMEDDLLARLKQYAQAQDLSASAVVREALTQYLDGRQRSPFELGAALFGRHRSDDSGASSRSERRKGVVRERLRTKHDRP
ncbi:MAG: ribbon-helix-helix protein, CopG family [Rhodanobacteraceae bacterium]|nr:ribbon-helix-helix protein, CopG family [Rhodanobacteraceae bacterium]